MNSRWAYGRKIALIGAGSHFTMGLVYDIIYSKDLRAARWR